MGGAGGMLHAIKSLKANRELLKKRKLKSKDDIYGKQSVTKLHFKKSTRRDILRIQKKMFIQRQREKRQTALAVVVTLILFLVLFLLFS
ncbi:hypothetical protein [Allomuricauda sp. NBRC 101325]|uniref:hypothetical protein n=1 Tax=Allomuricauda sp. NBRC 101325 TaxID=1113758 RepID=UPI0024A14F28|nr:hypothetical protein [Muricauda sp. NBRC 101325]GLU45064.1 hypothetical protein Musp01_26880 [Muricauda sp. NBRC 101325]